jgi:hypothetical protein
MNEVLVLVSLVLLVDVLRRRSWHYSVSLVAIYAVASLIVLYAAVFLGIGADLYNAWYLRLVTEGQWSASLMHGALVLTAWAASFGGRQSSAGVTWANARTNSRRSRSDTSVLVLLLLLLFGTVVHAAVLDWNLYWHTTVYTVQTSSELMGITFFPAVYYHKFMPIVAIIACVLLFYLISEGKAALSILALFVFLYCWIYQLTAHSRWAAASLLLGVSAYAMIHEKNRRLYLLSTLPLGALALIYVRIGRQSGNHGLSTIWSNFGNFDMALLPQYFVGGTYNVLQGIFTTAASFASRFADYPEIYKLLSFSPLPSSLDQFDYFHALYEVRVSSTIPLSAWVEAARFGYLFQAILLGTVFGVMKLNTKLLGLNRSVVSSTASFIILALVIFLGSYEVRNVYRFLIVVALIQLFLIAKTRKAADRNATETKRTQLHII